MAIRGRHFKQFELNDSEIRNVFLKNMKIKTCNFCYVTFIAEKNEHGSLVITLTVTKALRLDS